MPRLTRHGLSVEEKANAPFAVRLRSLQKKGDTQKLANYVGCSVQAINQYRQGTARPQFEKLIKIAEFYNVTTDYILGKVEVSSPDISIQGACITTGLSEDSINTLANAMSAVGYEDVPNPGKNRVGILDLLIRDSDFFMALLSDIYMCYEEYRDFKHAEKRYRDLKETESPTPVFPGTKEMSKEERAVLEKEFEIGDAFNLMINRKEKYEVAVFKANRRFGAILDNLINGQLVENEQKEVQDG